MAEDDDKSGDQSGESINDSREPPADPQNELQSQQTKAKEMEAKLRALRVKMDLLKKFDLRLLNECKKIDMAKKEWSTRQIRSMDLYLDSYIRLRDLNWDVADSLLKWSGLTGKTEEELEEEGPVKPSSVDKLDKIQFIEEIKEQLLLFAECQPARFKNMPDYREIIQLPRSEPTNLTKEPWSPSSPPVQTSQPEGRTKSKAESMSTTKSKSESVSTTKSVVLVLTVGDLENKIEKKEI